LANFIIRNQTPDSPTLPSCGIQQLLEEASSDALLLYDCCHSSHPAVNIAGQGVTELLAACAFETQAPAPGVLSFTNALIKVLEQSFWGPPVTVATVHRRMMGIVNNWQPDLLKQEGRVWLDANGKPRYESYKPRTPVRCVLTEEDTARAIILTPLVVNTSGPLDRNDLDAHQQVPKLSGASQEPDTTSYPVLDHLTTMEPLDVLLVIRLEEDVGVSDYTDQKKRFDLGEWLKNMPHMGKYVKIQGIYRSNSTIVLLTLPVGLWDLLPDNPAYSFIGFVHPNNLALPPSSLPATIPTSVDHMASPELVQNGQPELPVSAQKAASDGVEEAELGERFLNVGRKAPAPTPKARYNATHKPSNFQASLPVNVNLYRKALAATSRARRDHATTEEPRSGQTTLHQDPADHLHQQGQQEIPPTQPADEIPSIAVACVEKPIKFTDIFGRRFLLPYESCKTYAVSKPLCICDAKLIFLHPGHDRNDQTSISEHTCRRGTSQH
jgi:hypothetical protein